MYGAPKILGAVEPGKVADLPAGGLEPSDITDLRRTLYGLHAILRLHFDQEEELYASLDGG